MIYVCIIIELFTDSNLYTSQCSLLLTCVNKDFVISKSFVTMLKKLMTKSVAMQFTAVRRSSSDKTKRLFKGTEVSKCMEGKYTIS